MWLRLALIVAGCLLVQVKSSKDVMHQMSINFGKPFEACKNELNLPDPVIQDFFNFWKEGHELSNRLTGCAILCMASKLDLLEGESGLHHGNAMEFAKKHGADEAMAKQLMDIMHKCSENAPAQDDPCLKTLNIAACFKTEIHKLDWAPDPQLLAAEFLAET